MRGAVTQFCGAEIPLWGDLPALFVDGNSKITRDDGTYEAPKPNAFSLPHISCCPGSTPTCRAACYAWGLAESQREIYRRYSLNAAALHRVLLSNETLQRSAAILATWIRDNCTAFRWHVSGDVISERHASWISMVCARTPTTEFWIYTRTLEAVPTLLAATNLVVNVSADASNYARAAKVANQWVRVRLCYLTRDGSIPDDLPTGSVIFPDYGLRGRSLDEPTSAPWWQSITHAQRAMVCGADFFGQSESQRCGPCTKCLVQP